MIEALGKDFSKTEGKTWLNTASEGAIPGCAAAALTEAGSWKQNPYKLTLRKFREIPEETKSLAGQLWNVSPEDIILGNSATYAIHLLANGIPFKADDEVLLQQNDFPVDILPWLGLAEKGVNVHQVKAQHHVLSLDELRDRVTEKTRVVCLPHVHTFSGHVTPVNEIGHFCRQRKITFIVNVSQSTGYMPIDISSWPVDAVTSAGYKWLCGPYGSGLGWIRADLREKLKYNQAYWANVLSADELQSEGVLSETIMTTAKRYDVFGTANFFNLCPLNASLRYLLSIGIGAIKNHNDTLVDKLLSQINHDVYDIISPLEKESRSALIVISHKDVSKNAGIFQQLLGEGLYTAFWKGRIRISPHLYNSEEDINGIVSQLNGYCVK